MLTGSVMCLFQLCFNFSSFAKYAFHSSSIIRQFIRLNVLNWLFLLLLLCVFIFSRFPSTRQCLTGRRVCFQHRIFRGLVFTHLTCFPHLVCDFSQGGLISHHRFKVNTLLTQFLTLTGKGCHSHFTSLSSVEQLPREQQTTSYRF